MAGLIDARSPAAPAAKIHLDSNQIQDQDLQRVGAVCGQASKICASDMVALLVLKPQGFELKYGIGVSPQTIDYSDSISVETVRRNQPLVVTNLRLDKRFAESPYVTGDTHLRFYAGVPLHVANGDIFGVLALLARRAGTFDPEKLRKLELCAEGIEKIAQAPAISGGDILPFKVERRSAVIRPDCNFVESSCDVFEPEVFLREVDRVVEMSLVRSRCAGLVGIELRRKGHPPAVGLLPAVERALVSVLRPRLRRHDLIARLPQRRFAVLLPLLRYRADLEFVAGRIESLLRDALRATAFADFELRVSTAMYPIDGYGGDDLANSLFQRTPARFSMK
ncbi:MAG: GAF domain-containing protein [Hyphomicrobiales bacterium]|nr:GAF domain-containing protein [Hyphomicrobiales bacterium]